jgi:hypothetical protein
MAQLDLQIDEKPRRGRNGRQPDYRLVQQPRPRGLIGQVSALLLQPGFFFRTLPALESSRQWLVFAVLLLAISGAMAVRQAELNAAPSDSGVSGMDLPPEMMDPGMGGGGMSGDFGGIPPDMGMPVPGDTGGGGSGGATSNVSTTWTTAIVAAGALLVAWLVQAVLLSEVTLFNGRAPRLGLNLQIAVYASIPLALMTGVQALYIAAGGVLGEPGLTGLITEWDGFSAQTPFVQALLISLTSHLTLFWLWSLLLLYLGARHALRGRWWASVLVVLAWVTTVTVVPVISGAITAPPTEEAIVTEGMPGDMPPDAFPMDGGMEGMSEDGALDPAMSGDTGSMDVAMPDAEAELTDGDSADDTGSVEQPEGERSPDTETLNPAPAS